MNAAAAREDVLREFQSDEIVRLAGLHAMADEIVRLRLEVKRLRDARKGYIDLDALREGGVV